MGAIDADIVLKTLAEEGVEVIFGYPGANTLPLNDRLADSTIRQGPVLVDIPKDILSAPAAILRYFKPFGVEEMNRTGAIAVFRHKRE